MRFVIVYNVSDDCTYSHDIHNPLEYIDKQSLEYDLMNALLKSLDTGGSPGCFAGEIEFVGKRFNNYEMLKHDKKNFEIYTLDEWFEKYNKHSVMC